ncbi:hypothetical protein V5O48_000629 [Marasmius crinis-equi]|uniref:Alpha/beta hydrolase fold-3 domain-containing protein n=1 Tax=Marasmius crinis-equi TaxID=585013 RepID=A0ABR3G0K0_9AGAR
MIYDQTPQYEHHAHLPYSKEPLKGLYVFQRLLTTLLLAPCWFVYYAVLPRSYRPRPSWNLRQIIFVNFTRRIYRVTEVAGVHFGTRDPESEPKPDELKETRFEWAPPLEQRLRRGVVVDPHGKVPFKRVGTYVWPKERPVEVMSQKTVEEAAREDENLPVVGIFMHGGGFCQMSAHEGSRTSHIPRRLMKDNLFSEIYSVEYRLLQHAPIPATVMDAATVYAHVISQYYSSPSTTQPLQRPCLRSTPNGSNLTLPLFTGLKKRCKIVLIGDSSGGNLVLSIARWLRDEKLLPEPDGLLLFSPSCDTSHAFPVDPCFYVPRPNASTDYLTDTPEPRALLQRTFLGFKAHGGKWDAWVAKEDPTDRMGLFRLGSAGAASVISLGKAIARPVRTMLPFESAAGSTSSLPTELTPDERRCPHQEIVDKEKARENYELMRVVHSEYVSPASPKVLKRWGHPVDLYDGGKLCECKGDLDDERFDCGHEDLKVIRRKLTAQSDPALHVHVSGQREEVDIGLVGKSRHLQQLGTRVGGVGGDGWETDSVSTMTPENSPIPAFKVPAVAQMETLKEEDRSTSHLKEEKEADIADGNKEHTTTTSTDATAYSSDNTHNRVDSKASTATAVTTTQHVPPKITITPFDGETEEFTTPRRHLRTRAGAETGQNLGRLNPYTQYPQRYPQFKSLFEGFPKTLILLGDAERLTIEVVNLARAMSRDLDEEDGKKMVTLRWVKDAVHDPFIIPPGWWDEKVKSEVWEDVKGWMKEVKSE